jgi:hypothetical protein
MENLFRQFGYKLINFIKHIMAFKDIFKKSSDFNEKTIIGFLSFAVMVLAIVVDLVTGYLGRPLELNEYIFDAFMWIVLGSFLPDVLEKFAEIRGGKKNNNEE